MAAEYQLCVRTAATTTPAAMSASAPEPHRYTIARYYKVHDLSEVPEMETLLTSQSFACDILLHCPVYANKLINIIRVQMRMISMSNETCDYYYKDINGTLHDSSSTVLLSEEDMKPHTGEIPGVFVLVFSRVSWLGIKAIRLVQFKYQVVKLGHTSPEKTVEGLTLRFMYPITVRNIIWQCKDKLQEEGILTDSDTVVYNDMKDIEYKETSWKTYGADECEAFLDKLESSGELPGAIVILKHNAAAGGGKAAPRKRRRRSRSRSRRGRSRTR